MLWGVFFVVLALGVSRLTVPAGWLTLILSLTTCTIPGFLLLLGDWGKVPTWAVLASIVATAHRRRSDVAARTGCSPSRRARVSSCVGSRAMRGSRFRAIDQRDEASIGPRPEAACE